MSLFGDVLGKNACVAMDPSGTNFIFLNITINELEILRINIDI